MQLDFQSRKFIFMYVHIDDAALTFFLFSLKAQQHSVHSTTTHFSLFLDEPPEDPMVCIKPQYWIVMKILMIVAAELLCHWRAEYSSSSKLPRFCIWIQPPWNLVEVLFWAKGSRSSQCRINPTNGYHSLKNVASNAKFSIVYTVINNCSWLLISFTIDFKQ